jgi:hypothetical protein
MRARTGIADIDTVDGSLEPAAPRVDSIEDLPPDAEAADISRTTRRLDALADRPQLRRIVARGANDAMAQRIGRVTTLQHLTLPGSTVSDLRALAGLRELRTVRFSVNARLVSLEGIEGCSRLELFSAWTCTALTSIDALRTLSSLRVLFLAGGMYKPMRIASLAPIANATGLLALTLSNVRVVDESLRPLLDLTALRRLELPLFFAAEEYAAVEKALPHARGQWRESWRHVARRRVNGRG